MRFQILIEPFWQHVLLRVEGAAQGGMGEGEKAHLVLPADLAYGTNGNQMLGVPPGSPIHLTVTLCHYVLIEDLSREKDGRCIRRILRRGHSEECPRRSDECDIALTVKCARTGEVWQEKPSYHLVVGEMPERVRREPSAA